MTSSIDDINHSLVYLIFDRYKQKYYNTFSNYVTTFQPDHMKSTSNNILIKQQADVFISSFHSTKRIRKKDPKEEGDKYLRMLSSFLSTLLVILINRTNFAQYNEPSINIHSRMHDINKQACIPGLIHRFFLASFGSSVYDFLLKFIPSFLEQLQSHFH